MKSEAQKSYDRKWYLENRERILSESKYRYKENPEPIKAARRAYATAHPEKVNTSNRKWRSKNPTKNSQYHRKWRYGVSSEMFESMLVEQNFCCALCGAPFEDAFKLKPAIDHNHKTRKNRSILHNQCNLRLGFIEDAEFCTLAHAYLEKHKERQNYYGTASVR